MASTHSPLTEMSRSKGKNGELLAFGSAVYNGKRLGGEVHTAGYIPFDGTGVLKVDLCVIQDHENDAEEDIHTNVIVRQVSTTLSIHLRTSGCGLNAQ